MGRTSDSTGRAGVHAVGLIFTKDFNWIFREQHESDHGIDAQVEVVDDGKATGKLFALQIKAGNSHLRKKGDGYVYRGELRHLNYWLNHVLPVFLIVHDPDTGTTLWQKIEDAACTVTGNGWSIDIPNDNVLDERARPVFEAVRELSAEESRRERLRDDLDLIEILSNPKSKGTFELTVDNDEEIGLTDLDIECKDAEGKTCYRSFVSYGGGGFTAHETMQQHYWYLDYDYAEEVYREEDFERHTFDVSVKPEVLGYVKVEKILREGPPPTVELEIPYEESEEDDMRAALVQDWINEQEEEWSREADEEWKKRGKDSKK